MCQRSLKSAYLKGIPFNVFDQHPQRVQRRREALIPDMVKARSEGKRANLVRDKLFVNNKEYIQPGGARTGEKRVYFRFSTGILMVLRTVKRTLFL